MPVANVYRLKRQQDVGALLRLLNSDAIQGRLSVRGEAARALGQLKVEQAVEPLTNRLTADRRPEVRKRAAGALGEIGSAAGVHALTRALGDEDEKVRLAAAKSLGRIRDERSVQRLIEALNDRSLTVRRSAATALGLIGVSAQNALQPLLALAAHDRLTVRSRAIEAIAHIDGPTARSGLQQVRRGTRNPIVRRLVTVELKRLTSSAE
jgi:HEAT repeat protein